jgi:hypothetical protein
VRSCGSDPVRIRVGVLERQSTISNFCRRRPPTTMTADRFRLSDRRGSACPPKPWRRRACLPGAWRGSATPPYMAVRRRRAAPACVRRSDMWNSGKQVPTPRIQVGAQTRCAHSKNGRDLQIHSLALAATYSRRRSRSFFLGWRRQTPRHPRPARPVANPYHLR